MVTRPIQRPDHWRSSFEIGGSSLARRRDSVWWRDWSTPLLIGLRITPASSSSLLLNLEGVFTAMIAWFIFKENFDRRIALGMLAIIAGGALLSWSGRPQLGLPWGPLALIAACLGNRQQPDAKCVHWRSTPNRGIERSCCRRGEFNHCADAWCIDSRLSPDRDSISDRLSRLWCQPRSICFVASAGRYCSDRGVFFSRPFRRRVALNSDLEGCRYDLFLRRGGPDVRRRLASLN